MRFIKCVFAVSIILLAPYWSIFGQAAHQHKEIKSISLDDSDFERICTLTTTNINAHFYVESARMRNKRFKAEKTAEFQVTYFQESGSNPWSSEKKAAFEFALDIWATHIKSDIPIRIAANWRALGERTLGSAGPTEVLQIENGEPLTLYPIAQASAISGIDYVQQLQASGEDTEFDIVVNMNSAFGNWYFGTDAQTPEGLYDFVTVALHEVGHGLGFLGSMWVPNGQNVANWGYGFPPIPLIYDRFTIDGNGMELINQQEYTNNSTGLYDAVTGKNGGVFFAGLNSISTNNGFAVPLYAPSDWNAGSSYSHVDLDTYSNTEDALMRPQIDAAYAVHSPGPVVCSIMTDKGWPVGEDCENLLGSESEIMVNETDLDFGITNTGKRIEKFFDISNDINASDPLVGRISISGSDNYIMNNTSRFINLQPGENRSVRIVYNADSEGEAIAELEIIHTSSSVPSPLIITLKGEALAKNENFKLEQNYPNPFNASTVIPYALAQNAQVNLEVYDAMGKRVQTLINEEQSTGRYTIPFHASDLSSGLYIYRLTVEGESKLGKLLLVK